MVRNLILLSVALSLVACQQLASEDATAQDNAARLTRLETRVDKLETQASELSARLNSQPPRTVPQLEQSAVAVLAGSTRDGSPIETEYSSMQRCIDARAALLAEGDRACAGRNPEDSTRSRIYGHCPKPQASCSLK